MEITKVEIQKNNEDRVNIYLDDKFYAGMYLDTCIKYGLKAGVSIELEKLDEYIVESEKHTAFNKTVNYLKSTLKTKKQVRDYLYKKEYSAPTIKYVIEKLEEYGFVSDRQYAIAYINTYRKNYGTMRLKGNLIAKGVDKDLVDECLQEAMEENPESSIMDVAKKYLKNKTLDEKNIQKLIRFLSYRGYEFDSINSLLSALKKGDIE